MLSRDTETNTCAAARLATAGVAAYEAVSAAAQQDLVLGLHVVVDAVNNSEAARQVRRDAAARTGNVIRFVLLLPPTIAEHQRRLRVVGTGIGYWCRCRAKVP